MKYFFVNAAVIISIAVMLMAGYKAYAFYSDGMALLSAPIVLMLIAVALGVLGIAGFGQWVLELRGERKSRREAARSRLESARWHGRG